MKVCLHDRIRPDQDDTDKIEKNDRESYLDRRYDIEPQRLINPLREAQDYFASLFAMNSTGLTTNQRSAFRHCLHACTYQSLTGLLACMRAHPEDQDSYQRKEIEFCIFAIKILFNPHHATLWLECTESNTKFEKYKKAFPIMEILKETYGITGIDLKKRYNELCKTVHASAYAIVPQVESIVREGQEFSSLRYHRDASEEEKHSITEKFFVSLEYDLKILRCLTKALEVSSPNIEFAGLQKKMNCIDELLVNQRHQFGHNSRD